MKERDLQITVEDLGPIRFGRFSLKPLTVFIGPNNSGKSYAALLVYALTQGLSGRVPRAFLRPETFEEFFFKQLDDTRPAVPFHELAPERQDALRRKVDDRLDFISTSVDFSLREYFGYPWQTMVRSGGSRQTATILVNDAEQQPFLALEIGSGDPTVALTPNPLDHWSIPSLPVPMAGAPDDALDGALAWYLWSRELNRHGLPRHLAYYLPSARSGILSGSQAYLSLAVEMVRRRAGLEPIQVAPFEGVAGDFLQILATLQQSEAASEVQPGRERIKAVLSLLEKEVFRGRVELSQGPGAQPSMRYESGSLSLPIQRSSSMVAELAPLYLWVRHLLVSGDLLIIDEPEAHLHPANQRLIARVLVRLVRAGVHVLCPTHSSLILHQISNLLLAAKADADVRKELGLTDDDLIDADEVGVYLFDLQEDGTSITPVPIEPDFGIPEDEFVRVSEAIGDETYRLETAILADAVTA